MKEILKPYLNTTVIMNAQYSGMGCEVELFKAEDNYFGIIDNAGGENFCRYFPYSSISEITERNKTLTIKIQNSDELMEIIGQYVLCHY